MDWKDVLITQAISTVIAIAKTSDGRGKFRPALLKVFKTIAAAFREDDDFAIVVDSVRRGPARGSSV